MDELLLLRASVVWIVTLALARLLARAPAATRHRLWTVGFSCVLLLPLLSYALPAIAIPLPVAPSFADHAGLAALGRVPPADGDVVSWRVLPISRRSSGQPGDSPQPSLSIRRTPGLGAVQPPWLTVPMLLVAIWIGGCAVALARLVLSLLRVQRVARSSWELRDEGWLAAAHALSVRLGLRRPVRLLVSSSIATPMAGGIWRPVIFLPVVARAWNDDQRDVVLAHEMAHLAGLDPLRHAVARLAVASYWFHPLSWIAARQATAAREHACDEAVLALGTRPSVYARVLLDLAEALPGSLVAVSALPMSDRSLLESRVMAILEDDVRPVVKRRGLISVVVVTLLTLSVAAAQPSSRAAQSSLPPTSPLAAIVAAPLPDAAAAGPARVSAAAIFPAGKQTRSLAGQLDVDRESACRVEGSAVFTGSMTMSSTDGRGAIVEQIGIRGNDRVIQKRFGDLRLCMLAEGAGDSAAAASSPSQWLGRAKRVVLEARRGTAVQRLEVLPQGDGPRVTWQIGGQTRPFDAAGERWRDRMLALFDTIWELSALRGHVSSLRGQISSVRGHQSSLRGEISSLGGHVSSLRGQISSLRGHESSLRGQISSIRGHVSALQGAMSSERGAISSIEAYRYATSQSERAAAAKQIDLHRTAIAQLEREIRDFDAEAKITAIEREMRTADFDGKVAAVEAEIRAFDAAGRIAAIERQIEALNVEGKVVEIERQIAALDADRRSRQLEDRRDDELKQLEAAIAAIR